MVEIPNNYKKIYTNLKALTRKWFYTKEENDNLINPLKDYVGINLFPNSRSFTGGDNVTLLGETTEEYYNNYAIRKIENKSGTNQDLIYTIQSGDYQAGDRYILSFWAKGSGSINCFFASSFYDGQKFVKVKVINVSGDDVTVPNSSYNYGQVTLNTLSSNWRKYIITWEINPNPDSNEDLSLNKNMFLRFPSDNKEKYICGISFEKIGNSISSSNLSDNTNIVKKSSTNGLIKNDGTIATDTGWVSLESYLDSNFENYYQDSNFLKYKKVGNVVQIIGVIKAKNKITPKTNGNVDYMKKIKLADLPAEILPSSDTGVRRVINHGSEQAYFLITVGYEGNENIALGISRYYDPKVSTSTREPGIIEQDAWLNIYITYLL